MCAEKFNFQKIARRNAMCTWRELGRSTDSFEDYLEAKMRQIRFYLLGIPADDDIKIVECDSAAEFSHAVQKAGRRAARHLQLWAETCHASRVSVDDILPTVANESEALENLFRFELGDHDNTVPYSCYVPDGWGAKNGKRTPVCLAQYVPRAVAWRDLVAVEWCMRGAGRGNMPQKNYDLAFETIIALHACAAFVILDNGVALVCQRPVGLEFDSKGRLGCIDGPAVVWTNGDTEWYLADQAFPRVLRDRCNQLYHGTANPWPQPDMEWEEKITRDLCDDYLYPVPISGAELTKIIREGLAENPLFSSWFYEEDLRAGRYIVWDTVGPWTQGGRTVLREMQLRRVERGSEVRHYLCELGADHHADRIIEVPDRFFLVDDALAWTFDPQGFSKAAGEKTEP
jgi:hypothetical protein